MNTDMLAEIVADLAELTHPPAKPRGEEKTESREPPISIPAPPAPGKTAWSIAPW